MAVIRAGTIGSKKFTPDNFSEQWQKLYQSTTTFIDDTWEDGFRDSIIGAFDLPQEDDFVYHAVMSVTLADVQGAVNAGLAKPLCVWYRDEKGDSVGERSIVTQIVFLSTALISKATSYNVRLLP